MSSRDIKLIKPHITSKNNKITQEIPYNNVFIKTGYKATSKIASTLQGSVYKGTHTYLFTTLVSLYFCVYIYLKNIFSNKFRW